MKGSRWVKCILALLIIGCLTFANLMGIPKTNVKKVQDSMRYGIDIKGGISAVFVPDVKNINKIKTKDLEAVKARLDLRLEGQGIYDKTVNVDQTNKRLIVEIPYKPGQTNPQAALDEIGKTAMLTFREVDMTKAADNPSLTATATGVKNTDTKTDLKKSTASPKKDKSETTSTTKISESPKDTETSKASESPKKTDSKETSKPSTTDTKKPVSDEKLWADNKIVVNGNDVVSASAGILQSNQQPIINLEFSKNGAKKFSEATGRLAKLGGQGLIAIYLDNQLITYPSVSTQINDGKGYIEGKFTTESAKKLANEISAGALPFNLKTTSVNSISPTLGEGAMLITVYAGLLAFLIVFLFMVSFYRLPGLIANIALVGLVTAQLLMITSMSISLTLPGIAGIILTVGMGVDANIITFERMKEELRAGKSLLAAIDMGFKRSFPAIIDSHITTIISSLILMWLGSGPVAGFAKTLLIGIVLSLISSLIGTRVMLKAIATLEFLKARWLYAAKGGEAKNA